MPAQKPVWKWFRCDASSLTSCLQAHAANAHARWLRHSCEEVSETNSNACETMSPFGFKHVDVEYDSHCTLGALQHVAADGRSNDYHLPGTVGLTSAAAIALADSMWPNEFKSPSLYVSKAHWAEAHIAQWNDHDVSNATEVAAKLRRAAEEYKE